MPLINFVATISLHWQLRKMYRYGCAIIMLMGTQDCRPWINARWVRVHPAKTQKSFVADERNIHIHIRFLKASCRARKTISWCCPHVLHPVEGKLIVHLDPSNRDLPMIQPFLTAKLFRLTLAVTSVLRHAQRLSSCGSKLFLVVNPRWVHRLHL